eukprot:6873396-Pyramimonas_sp.AAC.1
MGGGLFGCTRVVGVVLGLPSGDRSINDLRAMALRLSGLLHDRPARRRVGLCVGYVRGAVGHICVFP